MLLSHISTRSYFLSRAREDYIEGLESIRRAACAMARAASYHETETEFWKKRYHEHKRHAARQFMNAARLKRYADEAGVWRAPLPKDLELGGEG